MHYANKWHRWCELSLVTVLIRQRLKPTLKACVTVWACRYSSVSIHWTAQLYHRLQTTQHCQSNSTSVNKHSTNHCKSPIQAPVSYLNNHLYKHLSVTWTSTCQSPVQAPVSHLHRVHASHLNKHLPITWTRRPMRTHARWPAVPCTSQPPSSQNRTTEWTTEVSLDGHLTRYEMRWKTVPAKDAFSCTSKVNNHCVAN